MYIFQGCRYEISGLVLGIRVLVLVKEGIVLDTHKIRIKLPNLVKI